MTSSDQQQTQPAEVRVKCGAMVYVRDTYRLRRGHGLKMHYTRRQCERQATDHFRGHDYCWQHAKQEKANRLDWDIPL